MISKTHIHNLLLQLLEEALMLLKEATKRKTGKIARKQPFMSPNLA